MAALPRRRGLVAARREPPGRREIPLQPLDLVRECRPLLAELFQIWRLCGRISHPG
ncbi:hypothetical protein [Falsiroseomonas oryziterrae]|uniref:hypothetical protein n=1 Tax=Falsiroseomonas oryziterrae TaxID=2911368 RepID=UPI001F2933D6|nr:hypothetical protein [Roseomonas sp. NPKOSM-4]